MNSSKYFDHLVVFTAGIGMFLSTLDSGIINVALPTLSKSFNVDISFYYLECYAVYFVINRYI